MNPKTTGNTGTTVMLGEVLEQPAALARTIAALGPRAPDVRRLARDRPQVLFAARGSSDNAATYGRYLVEVAAGRAAGPVAPSVATVYRRRLDLRHALVVGISQSGETAEQVEVLEWARACGAATIAVTNVSGSALDRAADLALVTDAGPEQAIPATKTFTTQLVAMVVLARALATEPEALPGLDRVPDAVAAVLARRAGVDRAVEVLLDRPHTVVTGRGVTHAVAAEVALKLEETCLRPVRGLSYADLRHGPIAVLDDRAAVVVVAPQDGPTVNGLARLVPDLRSRAAAVIGLGFSPDRGGGIDRLLGAQGDALVDRRGDAHVAGPDLPELLAPIGLVAAGQLLVEGLAGALGLNPDAPRGLRKVTQTDVEEPA